MNKIVKKKLLKIVKRGTVFALATVLFANMSPVYAETAGDKPRHNTKFAKNCYYNRSVECTSKKCFVSLKLFKNATTVSEYTTNPQPLSIEGKVYYLNGKGGRESKSLNVTDNRQTSAFGRSVSAPDNHKFICGYANFMISASQQGEPVDWNN